MSALAAIYARKSTDQTGVAEDQKSVARQVEHGRAYAARKGWHVSDEHVFVDDGISGAEFANRPGFVRLMNALKPRPAFSVLIMSEESRLGRESIETAYALKQLVQAGVRVFFYLEDRERTLDSPMDKVMLSLANFAADVERERASQRTHDAFVDKAKAGHVTGGRVFGYDNVRVDDHIERRINEAEASVVRRIFQWCADGWGYTRISKGLNRERAPAPRPQQNRPAGWSPSTVRDVLMRELYRGTVVWNRTRKRDRWGQANASPRPESEWLRIERPELRVVSEEAWSAVQVRLSGIRARLATARGDRPAIWRDIDSAYLLSGFARCSVCGGTLSVVSRSHGRQRAFFYACLAHAKRGAAVCSNRLVMPVATVDDAVLKELAGESLRPEVVVAIVDAVFDELKPAAVTANLATLHADLRALDRRIANLTTAIEDGAAVAPLVAQLTARQKEREELLTGIAAAEAIESLALDRGAIQRQVLAKTEKWRELLTSDVEGGRRALREVLEGPLRFAPEGKNYRFEGEVTTGRLVAGLVTPCVASPTGFEPVF